MYTYIYIYIYIYMCDGIANIYCLPHITPAVQIRPGRVQPPLRSGEWSAQGALGSEPWSGSREVGPPTSTNIQLLTLLDLRVSSLRRGRANLLCIVPILTDDPRREFPLTSTSMRPAAADNNRNSDQASARAHMAHFQLGSFLIGLFSNWAQF